MSRAAQGGARLSVAFPFFDDGRAYGKSADFNEVIARFLRQVRSWDMEGAAPQSLKTGKARRIP
jgi:hypothetical protein